MMSEGLDARITIICPEDQIVDLARVMATPAPLWENAQGERFAALSFLTDKTSAYDSALSELDALFYGEDDPLALVEGRILVIRRPSGAEVIDALGLSALLPEC